MSNVWACDVCGETQPVDFQEPHKGDVSGPIHWFFLVGPEPLWEHDMLHRRPVAHLCSLKCVRIKLKDIEAQGEKKGCTDD